MLVLLDCYICYCIVLCIHISYTKWVKYLVSYPFSFCWYLPSLSISTVKFHKERVTHFLNC